MTETQLVAWCISALSLRGVSCWRQNTGASKIPDRGKRSGFRFVRFGKKGGSDITGLLKDGRRLEVECKVGKNKQSPEQEQFQKMIENNNGLYWLIYTPNQLIDKMEGLGREDRNRS